MGERVTAFIRGEPRGSLGNVHHDVPDEPPGHRNKECPTRNSMMGGSPGDSPHRTQTDRAVCLTVDTVVVNATRGRIAALLKRSMV